MGVVSGEQVYLNHHPTRTVNDGEVVTQKIKTKELDNVKWTVLPFKTLL